MSGIDPAPGAAITVVDQVHLRRLVRRDVPTIVSLRCLEWYGAYRQADDAHAKVIAILLELGRECLDHPSQRAQLSGRIMDTAESVVSRSPTTLVDGQI